MLLDFMDCTHNPAHKTFGMTPTGAGRFALTLAIFLPTPSSHGAGSARWGEPAAATYDGPVTMLA
jgi:hypothetical protein